MTSALNHQQPLNGNNMHKLTTILLYFLIVNFKVISAQSSNYQQEYLNAKALYNDGKYSLAMEAFKPVIKADKANPFSSYASYYYALAAYKADYPALSRDMFLQIKQLYPKWGQMDEVNFWLAKLYFEQGKTSQGIVTSKEIKRLDGEIVSTQVSYFLDQIDSLEVLAGLNEEFPDSKEVGKRYAQLIQALPLIEQDRPVLNELAEQFGLRANEFNITTTLPYTKKDKYKVAVMLPFMMDDLRPSLSKKRNQFVIDLYQGMQKAVEDLEKDSVKLELFSYDTKKSALTTFDILSKDEMKSMDVIIGPLYPGPSHQTAEFSFQNKINMLNPLSTNSEVIGNNPFSFLYKPSDASEAKAAAQYLINSSTNKNTIIFYGDSKRDSLKAHTFKQYVELDSFKVILMERIDKDTSRHVLRLLTAKVGDMGYNLTSGLTAEEKKRHLLAPDSVGSIYVASENKLLASSVVSAVEIRSDTIKVIGSAEWLQYRFIDYDAYERLGIVLTAPNFINTNTTIYKDLTKYFVQKYSKPPSEHHFIGYDAMMFVGKMLHNHGKYFQIGLNELPFIESILSYGFNYQHANDNQLVPIIKFENNKLRVVPPPKLNMASKNE